MLDQAPLLPRRPRARPWAGVLLACACAPALAASASDPQDLRWLQRMGFGVDSAGLAAYAQDGRRGFLRAQLAAADGDEDLPAPVRQQLQDLPGLNVSAQAALAQVAARQEQIKAMPEGDARTAAKKALQEQKNQWVQQVRQAELLRAIYDPDQLREQLVWFWLNHFSVQADKARVGWVLGDYVDSTIRPHAMGRFADLVMATLKSPAMLDYLDNAQNAKGKVNENYARELMELHTLGVDAGYTQHDVQQLALVLTGVGIAPPGRDGPPRLKPQWQAQYVHQGAFEFNPARHQDGDKTLLGQRIAGGGFEEVEQAVRLITRQPACAQFISRRLAEYFVADQPPPALVEQMAKAFERSDGDIAKVMQVMVQSRPFADASQRKFKDPYQYLVSSVRLAYDGQVIANPAPLVGWLAQMGEPLFGRITPDGWPLASDAWNSSGQMAKRFEIARAIGGGDARLFTPAQADGTAGKAEQRGGFPMPASRLFYTAIEPTLSPATRQALAQARSQQEWNAFLLASPDFNYR